MLPLLLAVTFLFSTLPIPALAEGEAPADGTEPTETTEPAETTDTTEPEEPAEPAEPQEVISMRTAASKTYYLGEEQFELVAYGDDIHYLDDNDVYRDIDNRWILKDGLYTNAANSFSLQVADTKLFLAQLQLGDQTLTMTAPRGSNSPTPTLDDDALADTDWAAMYGPGECLVFADFVPGADLIVGSSTHGVQLYLRQTGTTEVQPISLTVTSSLPTRISTDSDAVLYGAEGAEVFALSSPNAITPGAGGGQQIELQATRPGETVEPNVSVTVTGSNVADSFVASKHATTNYNSGNNMPYLRTGCDDPYGVRRIYIQFPLSQLPSDATIESAYIRLKLFGSEGTAPRIRARRVIEGWSSSLITWLNRPDRYMDYISGSVSNQGNNWYQIGVTTPVAGYYQGSYANYGFCIYDEIENDKHHWHTWYSSDAASPNKPELRITYSVPVTVLPYYDADPYDADENSAKYEISYWKTPPVVGYRDLTGVTPQFGTAVANAVNKWNAAGIPVTLSSAPATATCDIIFYYGTRAQLKNEVTEFNGTDIYGNEILANSYGYTHKAYGEGVWPEPRLATPNGTKITVKNIMGTVYVAVTTDAPSVERTTLHEMGHALGWEFHSTNASSVMWWSPQVSTLVNTDIRHLKQVYDRYAQ